MKRFLLLSFCLMLCLTAACAETFDPKATAIDMLTEVYGYTEDEASQFVFDDDGVGTIKYYPADHPSWIYAMTYGADRWLSDTTPFRTAYEAYHGESTVRDTLRMARQNNWFIEWTPEHREALRAWMSSDLYNIHIRRPFINLLGMDEADPAQVINEFFICCYGEESDWPAVLTDWRNDVLAQYGVSLDIVGDVPANCITAYTLEKGMYLEQTYVCEFKGEVPDDLASVFAAEPNLSGWTCVCGTMMYAQEVTYDGVDNMGMAAFEKDGQRILVLMDHDAEKDQWFLWTLGTKALYQDPAMELSITGNSVRGISFLIRYDAEDGVRQFRVSMNDPTDSMRGHFALCGLDQYQYVSNDFQATLRIDLDWNDGLWTYTSQQGEGIQKDSMKVDFSCWLGVCDIADFPDAFEKAKAMPNVLPEDCAVAAGVHFRQDHSSRSKDLGTLTNATIIRIKSMVPGDPFDWLQTSMGTLNGYVVSSYTSVGSDSIHINMQYPMPIAVCRNDAELKTGTGWFDKAVCKLPAGTKMHIVIDQGDWLYVDVPRGDISWLMDVDGTYGYIRKSDVKVVATESYLDWE